MTVVTKFLGFQPNVLRTTTSIQTALASSPRTDAPVPRFLRRTCHVDEATLDGFPVVTLTPRRPGESAELIYLHGGAYVNPLVRAHWSIIGAIIKRTGATVTVPSYGLAPQHTAADAYPFLEALYARVQHRAAGRDVYLAGDSAGGGLALGLAIDLCSKGMSRPTGLFLFSPWLDVSMSNPEAAALVPMDVMLDIPGLAWCGEQWAGAMDTRDPLVSPMFGDLSQLPPTFIYQGGRDIFLADAHKFAGRAVDVGAPVELRVTDGGFHVFVGASALPESRQVFQQVAQVMRHS